MTKVDVSIVIPALNEEKYIEHTLRALRMQDYKGRFEIIVADGDSDDDTAKISRKYADKVIVEKTRTIAAGRQSGCRAATGNIIAFTDADSHPQQNWLSELVKPFENGEVAASFGTLKLEDATPKERWAEENLFPIYFWLFNWLGWPTASGSNLAVRRDAFDHAGGFNPALTTAEDIELLNRVRRFGKIEFNPKSLVLVSARRIHKWGWWKFFWYHAGNFIHVHLYQRGLGQYEPVR